MGLMGVAAAQEVPNGEFVTGLIRWSASPGDLTWLFDATSPVDVPGAHLEGGGTDPHWIESSAFIATRTTLDYWAAGPHDWAIRIDGSEVHTGSFASTPWQGNTVALDAQCGLRITWYGQVASNDASFDAFTLGDVVCGAYLDLDGDGLCPLGPDLDGDGRCDGLEEADTVEYDCDDDDPEVSPQGDEIVASGVDEDCDGLESCYADTDGDGLGEDVVVTSDDWTCTAAGTADNADDICPGFDDRLDADLDGIPDGCDPAIDGSTDDLDPCTPDCVPSPQGLPATWFCHHGGPAIGWIGLGLIGVGSRRRSSGVIAA